MSVEKVKKYLKKWNRDKDVIVSDVSTATVELAAKAVGVVPARIAKTLCFENGRKAVVIVAAGDARIDNRKFKTEFGLKPKMLSAEDAFKFTGYKPGGICPFDLPETTSVFLDESLTRFDTVFPACGSANSAIEVTLEQLSEYSNAKKWVNVCKNWQETGVF